MLRYLGLKTLERHGAISCLELQPEYKVEINGDHFCTYTADFRYFDALRDQWVIEDVKSAFTNKDPASRLRRKAAELYHGILVEIVIDGQPLTRGRGRRKK